MRWREGAATLLVRAAFLLLTSLGMLLGADQTFLLETHSWAPYTPGSLGSGLVGLSTTRSGVDAAQSFMAGFPPEMPANNNINFITGAGAFLQQFIFDYAGLRSSAERRLSRRFTPLLPERIRRLELRHMSIRGRRADISVPAAK